MSLDNKYGTIKTIIRKKENPKGYNAVSLLTKLVVANRHLCSIKFKYSKHPQPEIVMVPLLLKNREHIPQWFTRLIPSLEQHLDVVIIRDKRLIGNQIEPIYSLTIIGELKMAMLVTHYIDTIYTTITRLVASKRSTLAQNNKKARRYNRANNEDNVLLTDAREGASQLRETIILSILKTLNNLLEATHRDYPVSYRNGQRRYDYVITQLKSKYTNSWRTDLSHRFG